MAMAAPVAVVCLSLALLAVALPACAQAPSPSHRNTVSEDGPRWPALTPAQRDSLAPLEREWPNLDASRKQKWLILAERYRTMPADERARIKERMTDWARLTPAERGQARLRYEETREFPEPDRKSRWRDYQALTPEEKKDFAARAAAASARTPADRSPGDAVRVDDTPRSARGAREVPQRKSNLVPNPELAQPPRQVAPTVLQAAPGATTTPINRRPAPPAHQQTGMPKIATTPEFVNRGTLLPKRGPQAAAVGPTPPRGVPASPGASSPR